MKIFVSIGDVNGIGIEIALRAHEKVKELAEVIYGVDSYVLKRAAYLLGLKVPSDMQLCELGLECEITPKVACGESGRYSFASFIKGVELARAGDVDALVTLPVNKKAWNLAGIHHAGHTEALREIFGKEAIMMMGKDGFYIALFTDHIPLSQVPQRIDTKSVLEFLLRLANSTPNIRACGVLGLNPHAGDDGVLGEEDSLITRAVQLANKKIGHELFFGALVPDVAFLAREKYSHYVAMYHDQGLIALKILHFDESVNISLGLPIIRTSVDHGTAYDIAYNKNQANLKSYENAIKTAISLANSKPALAKIHN